MPHHVVMESMWPVTRVGLLCRGYGCSQAHGACFTVTFICEEVASQPAVPVPSDAGAGPLCRACLCLFVSVCPAAGMPRVQTAFCRLWWSDWQPFVCCQQHCVLLQHGPVQCSLSIPGTPV
jgi:hypothetical protein